MPIEKRIEFGKKIDYRILEVNLHEFFDISLCWDRNEKMVDSACYGEMSGYFKGLVQYGYGAWS